MLAIISVAFEWIVRDCENRGRGPAQQYFRCWANPQSLARAHFCANWSTTRNYNHYYMILLTLALPLASNLFSNLWTVLVKASILLACSARMSMQRERSS